MPVVPARLFDIILQWKWSRLTWEQTDLFIRFLSKKKGPESSQSFKGSLNFAIKVSCISETLL
jgi:hypothetical protein